MKKSFFYSLLAISVLVLLFYTNLKPTIDEKDVFVKAELDVNTTGKSDYLQYLLDINIIKNEGGVLNIYPYFDGLTNLIVNPTDKDKYFVPENLGSGGEDYIIAKKALRDNLYAINDNTLVNYIVPNPAGEYSSRLYLNSDIVLSEVENPIILCVYTESKFGRKLSWVKKVPISITTVSD